MAANAAKRLEEKYGRLVGQLEELFAKTGDPQARMATAVALLHHKMTHFFWTGFYRLVEQDLVVGPYQGPLACAVLERDTGVCWACVQRREPVVVPDVENFPGHIACDSRSRSEIVVPVFGSPDHIAGVLDVDARKPGAFGPVDVAGLQRVAGLVYSRVPDRAAEKCDTGESR